MHITLIDPSRQLPEAAGRLARTAQEVGGSDLVLIGSASAAGQRVLLETATAVRKKQLCRLYFTCGKRLHQLNLDALLF